MDFNKIIGENIERIRNQRGWSQYSLSIQVDKTPSWMSKAEKGLMNFSVGTLNVLAEVLDIEILDLFAQVEPDVEKCTSKNTVSAEKNFEEFPSRQSVSAWSRQRLKNHMPVQEEVGFIYSITSGEDLLYVGLSK